MLSFLTRWAALVVVVGIASGLQSLAASETPGERFKPQVEITLANTTPDVASDITLELGLPQGDLNFSAIVGFIPGDWAIGADDGIPVGAQVGEVEAEITLGLINSHCSFAIPAFLELQNASLDQSETVSFKDEDGNGSPDFTDDADENGIFDGIDHWPEFIFRVLTETESDPIRRAAGVITLAGTAIFLQLVTFPPGTVIDERFPSDPSWGYPTVALLQDAGDPQMEPMPGVISDFCTPLTTTTTLFGTSRDNSLTRGVNEAGYPLLVNPPNGVYTFTIASSNQRDADRDNYENSLDTCPLTLNVGNPRVYKSGDSDADGLDAACDPNPGSAGTNQDEDGDGYLNRGDNCPLYPNGEEGTNQADRDFDQIGDECDPDPDHAFTEGDMVVALSTENITIWDGIGPEPTPGPPSPPLRIAGDGNGDGVVDQGDVLLTLKIVGGFLHQDEGNCEPSPAALSSNTLGATGGCVNVDCDSDVDIIDALLLLRFTARVPVNIPESCPPIGQPLPTPI
jgi:hypothetical protein